MQICRLLQLICLQEAVSHLLMVPLAMMLFTSLSQGSGAGTWSQRNTSTTTPHRSFQFH